MWRVCLSIASAVLLTLVNPPYFAGALGWVALTPLLLALDGVGSGRAAGLGWIAGSVGSLGVTGYWMYRAAGDYFALAPAPALLFTVAVNQVFVSAYFLLFGFAVPLLRHTAWRPLLIAAVFVSTEYARAHLFAGNPWAQLGHAQNNLALIQICDLSGVYGLSFLQALSAAAFADLSRRRWPLGLAALCIALALAYGSWRLQHNSTTASGNGPALSVALVQASLPNRERGLPRFYPSHLRAYRELTASLNLAPGTLVVWPENAVGFFPQENPGLLQDVRDLLARHDASLLFGAPRGAGSSGVAELYNSAYLLNANELRAVYDKRVLLPFVETGALREQDGPYQRGTGVGLFQVGSTQAAVLICYEAIYADVARRSVRQGARILFNISNDSWFDAGAGPDQHLRAAQFRAVENHVSLVRVTNSGVSAVFDANGRELLRLPKQSAAAQTVEVTPGSGDSFYSEHGDVFALACIAIAVIGILHGRIARKQRWNGA